jgi:hypothetical protein
MNGPAGWTDGRLRGLARGAMAFLVLTVLARIVLLLLDPVRISAAAVAEGAGFLVVVAAFPVVGWIILQQQPRNHVGWLLTAIGVVWGVGGMCDTWAHLGLVVFPGDVPGAGAAASVASIIWAPALGLTGTYLLMLFPDGDLPSPRWRALPWVSGGVVGLLVASLLLHPGALVSGPGEGLANPLGVTALRPVLDVAVPGLILLLALCILTSAASLVARFRRASGIRRQQLRWLAAAGSLVGTAFGLGIATSSVSQEAEPAVWQLVLDQVTFLLWVLFPVAIGISVLRYRLYVIDVVINRALVYGSLTALLAGVYLGSVLLLQLLLQPLTERSDLAVAASTLAVAGLFGPARRRIQVTVDRRFYRQKYDAARAVADFTTALRRQIDLDTVGADLLAAVHETVQPTSATIWMPGTGVAP